jgi:CRP-like cAMP-binding protein
MEQNQFDENTYQEVFLLLKDRVFIHLSDAVLHNIIKQSDQLHLHSGEVLFAEGGDPNYVYVVIHGRLGTHLSVAQSLDEGPTGLFPRGALIGEVGVIMDSPRTMAVIAHRNTRLLRLPAAAFKTIYSSVIAENPKQMQELYLMQLNRNKKLFTRMREGICYTFKILIPLQENLCIEPIISAIEEISQNEKHLYVLKAEHLKAMNNQNDRIAYLEELESIYQNILIIISLNTMDFIESILDIADKVILIANGDEPPCDNLLFRRLITAQNRTAHNTYDLILVQNNKNTHRYGHQWTSLESDLMVYYYFKNDEASLTRLYRYFSGQQIGLVLGGGWLPWYGLYWCAKSFNGLSDPY